MPVGDLDWMICNGGADIWQLLPEHDGKETTWVADEQWEGHISFRSVHLLYSLEPCDGPLMPKMTRATVPPLRMQQSKGLRSSSWLQDQSIKKAHKCI